MDWFPYDRDLRHEKLNITQNKQKQTQESLETIQMFGNTY